MTDFSYHGNTLYFSVYYIPVLVSPRKKREKDKRLQIKNAELYTGRQESEIYHFLQKSSSDKNHISLVKYFTPQDT